MLLGKKSHFGWSKPLFCLVKTTIRRVKTMSCLVKTHGNMAFFRSKGEPGETLCRNLRLWKAPATRPILVGNVLTSLGSMDLVRESSPNGPTDQGKYYNLPSGYVKIAIENGHL